MSPRPGISTLITSAPIHASNWVPVGPAWTWLKSRIRTPSSALLIRISGNSSSESSLVHRLVHRPAASHTSSRAVEKIAVSLSNPLFRRRAGVTRRLGRRPMAGCAALHPPYSCYGYPVSLFGGQVRSWLQRQPRVTGQCLALRLHLTGLLLHYRENRGDFFEVEIDRDPRVPGPLDHGSQFSVLELLKHPPERVFDQCLVPEDAMVLVARAIMVMRSLPETVER